MPSCADGKMNWIIPQKIFRMKSTQLEFFTKLYPEGNWRDIQPLKNN
jgi:carbonic anhydrase